MTQPQGYRQLARDLHDIFDVIAVKLVSHLPQRRRNQPRSAVYLPQEEARPTVSLTCEIWRCQIRRAARQEVEKSAQPAIRRSGKVVILEEPEINPKLELMPAANPRQVVHETEILVERRIVRLLIGVPHVEVSIVVIDVERGKPGRTSWNAGKLDEVVPNARIELSSRIAACIAKSKMVQQVRPNRVVVARAIVDAVHRIDSPAAVGRFSISQRVCRNGFGIGFPHRETHALPARQNLIDLQRPGN